MPSDSVSVLSKSYVFDPRPRSPFQIVANRYWIGECPDVASKTQGDVLTLVFMHGTGAHKEIWEPTIQRLFQSQQATVQKTVRFHDMWSLDMPNAGDSAILNEEVLLCGYHTSGLGTGVDIDFSERRLALVGHSMGGPVSILATTYYPLLKVPSLHLIEPFVSGGDVQGLLSHLSEISDKRRDIWPNSQEAFKSLIKRPFFRAFDERVLKIHVNHCLRPLPTAEYPELKEGVTLKCTRKQEAATFRDYGIALAGYRYLPRALKEIPTHITYGTVADFIPSEQQHGVLHVAAGGMSSFASVTRVPGAGHTIVQTHPDAVGDVIWKSLSQSHKDSHKDTIVAKL